MIFSADKKPTEPGWYWFRPDDFEPEIILVEDRGFGIRAFWVESGIDHDLPDGDWGDRVEFPAAPPVVEAPQAPGTLPEIWRCLQCGQEFDTYTFSHGVADHHPNCDGNCKEGKCPVERECGPVEKLEPPAPQAFEDIPADIAEVIQEDFWKLTDPAPQAVETPPAAAPECARVIALCDELGLDPSERAEQYLTLAQGFEQRLRSPAAPPEGETPQLDRVLRLLDTFEELAVYNTERPTDGPWKPEEMLKGYHLERIRTAVEWAISEIRRLRSREARSGEGQDHSGDITDMVHPLLAGKKITLDVTIQFCAEYRAVIQKMKRRGKKPTIEENDIAFMEICAGYLRKSRAALLEIVETFDGDISDVGMAEWWSDNAPRFRALLASGKAPTTEKGE